VGKVFVAVLSGIADGATYGLTALAIVLVYKATRVLNFGQAEIGTVAIYIEWELWRLHVPVYLALVVALALAALLGSGLEFVLRPLAGAPRLTVTVATLGLATMLGGLQLYYFHTDPHIAPGLVQGNLFTLADVNFTAGRVLALVVTAGLGFALYLFFKRTLFGLGVLAAAQDQKALRLMGLPLNLVSSFTWASGAVLSAIAGVILAPNIGAFTPFFITINVLIPGLAAALVGGLTSLPGAFVGGVVVGVTEKFAQFYLPTVPGAEYVAIFILIIGVLLFKPNGLLGAEA
jgi:branched-chain amino acid transport system permease protein